MKNSSPVFFTVLNSFLAGLTRQLLKYLFCQYQASKSITRKSSLFPSFRLSDLMIDSSNPSEKYKQNTQNVCMHAAIFYAKQRNFRHLAWENLEEFRCSLENFYKTSMQLWQAPACDGHTYNISFGSTHNENQRSFFLLFEAGKDKKTIKYSIFIMFYEKTTILY